MMAAFSRASGWQLSKVYLFVTSEKLMKSFRTSALFFTDLTFSRTTLTVVHHDSQFLWASIQRRDCPSTCLTYSTGEFSIGYIRQQRIVQYIAERQVMHMYINMHVTTGYVYNHGLDIAIAQMAITSCTGEQFNERPVCLGKIPISGKIAISSHQCLLH